MQFEKLLHFVARGSVCDKFPLCSCAANAIWENYSWNKEFAAWTSLKHDTAPWLAAVPWPWADHGMTQSPEPPSQESFLQLGIWSGSLRGGIWALCDTFRCTFLSVSFFFFWENAFLCTASCLCATGFAAVLCFQLSGIQSQGKAAARRKEK